MPGRVGRPTVRWCRQTAAARPPVESGPGRTASPCQARRMPTQRPQLKPALRRVWRDGSTIQLGVDPARAVVIGGLDAGSARLLESLDGSRDLRGLTVGAARLGVDADRLQ